MSFREVHVFEIREVLRLWLRGEGLRSIERLSSVGRKTVRRYLQGTLVCGLARAAKEAQITDELIDQICERVRPHRPDGHGPAWAVIKANHDQLKTWLVDDKLTVKKAHELLERRGVVVPERTLHRDALQVLGVGRSSRHTTVRVADGEPGSELQVDFGRMGLVPDTATGRRRVCWALIFTACYSRHRYVQLSFRQTTEAVISGFEAAWVPAMVLASVDFPEPLGPMRACSSPSSTTRSTPRRISWSSTSTCRSSMLSTSPLASWASGARFSAVTVPSGTCSMLDPPGDYHYAGRGKYCLTSPVRPIRRGEDARSRSSCQGRGPTSRSSRPAGA